MAWVYALLCGVGCANGSAPVRVTGAVHERLLRQQKKPANLARLVFCQITFPNLTLQKR